MNSVTVEATFRLPASKSFSSDDGFLAIKMKNVADLFNSPFTLNLASTPPYLDIVTKLLLISS